MEGGGEKVWKRRRGREDERRFGVEETVWRGRDGLEGKKVERGQTFGKGRKNLFEEGRGTVCKIIK